MARRLPDSAARRRRRHRGSLTAVLSVIGAFGAGWVLAPNAAVGRFRSAEAMDRYFAAYDRAMAQMPTPQQVLDIRTSFGVVRVYRFAGRRAGAPLFLLPGTQSSTPIWADNMPSLLAHRSVYTVDLLGEPGRSIQTRPITVPVPWGHRMLWDNSNIVESFSGTTTPLTFSFARNAYSIVYQLFCALDLSARLMRSQHGT